MSDENKQGQNTENKDTVSSVKNLNNTADTTTEFDPEDIAKNKTIAGLAYILFFLPLIACPDSKYGKYHANQALVLLLLGIVGNIVLGIIPIIGWALLPIFGILVFVLFIIGLLNGLNGRAKELPVIGKIKLLQ